MKITRVRQCVEFTKRTSLKITIVHRVKRKSAHSHHIIFGRLAGTRVQRPGGARASVEGAIDILHPGPGSNSPGASAADCSPIWRCPVLSPCYNRLLPKNRYPPVLAPTQNPEHQTHTRLRLRHFVRLDIRDNLFHIFSILTQILVLAEGVVVSNKPFSKWQIVVERKKKLVPF